MVGNLRKIPPQVTFARPRKSSITSTGAHSNTRPNGRSSSSAKTRPPRPSAWLRPHVRAPCSPPEVGHVRDAAVARRNGLAAARILGADLRHSALHVLAHLSVAVRRVRKVAIRRGKD